MRILLAAPLLALALPAAARDRSPPPPPSDSTARALAAIGDPRVQGAVTTVLDRLTDVLLDTRVGPVAMLADPNARVRSSDSVRDVIRRDDPAADAKLHDGNRRTIATIGRTAGAAAAFSAEIDRTADRLRAVLDGSVPSRR